MDNAIKENLKKSFSNLSKSEWQECKQAEERGKIEMAREMLKNEE